MEISNVVFCAIMIIIIILVCFFIYYCKYRKNVLIVSKVDNKTYRVLENHTQQQAADILGSISIQIDKLVTAAENSNLFNDYRDNVKFLRKQVKTLVLMENIENNDAITSYTLDKGNSIVLCLRSNHIGELHDVNLFITNMM